MTATPDLKIAIIGTGAVGGLLASVLARHGHRGLTLLGSPSSARTIATSGLTLTNAAGDLFSWRPQIVAEVPRDSHVLVATKAPGLTWALELLQHREPREIVTVLNGIEHPAQVRELFPDVAVVASSIIVEAARHGSASIQQVSSFLALEAPGAYVASPLLGALAAGGVEVTCAGTEAEVLWRKFRFLAPMALLTTLHALPIGPALAELPALTQSLLSEVAAVATAAGLPTSTVDISERLLRFPSSMRTSLQTDRASGHDGELDALGGALLRAADRLGVEAPTARRIVDLLQERP